MKRCKFFSRPSSRLLVGTLSVVALVISACGSTVQYSHSSEAIGLGSPEEGKLDVLTNEFDEMQSSDQERSTLEPGRTGASQLPNGDAQATAPNSRVGRVQDETDEQGGAGRGFTSNQISIGYATAKGAEDAANKFGISGAALGDQEGIARAVAKDINRRGGIAGRQINLVFYDIPASRGFNQTGRAQAAQEACALWTKDQPVFAVISTLTVFEDQTLASCLAKEQVSQIQANVLLRPDRIYEQFAPFTYSAHAASMERFVSGFVDRLRANKYFKGGWDADQVTPGTEPRKVGVLSRRDVYGSEFRTSVKNQLERTGLTVAVEFEWDGQVDTVSNSMNQAVLKFKEAGVTHILSQFNSLFFFASAAESQRYRPRYSIMSDNSPIVLAANLPKEQLRGSIGAGYAPQFDVTPAQAPGVTNRAQGHCRRILRDAGLDEHTGWDACDAFGLLHNAVKKTALSADGLRKGIDSIRSMPAAASFEIGYPAGRYDGGNVVRDLQYKEGCRCFEYRTAKNYGI